VHGALKLPLLLLLVLLAHLIVLLLLLLPNRLTLLLLLLLNLLCLQLVLDALPQNAQVGSAQVAADRAIVACVNCHQQQKDHSGVKGKGCVIGPLTLRGRVPLRGRRLLCPAELLLLRLAAQLAQPETCSGDVR
jgi:hypothetical protein